MKYIYGLFVCILLLGISCDNSDQINLNGEWELVDYINSSIDPPIKRFRIENDSILISTYRSYFDVGEGRIFKDSRAIFVPTGHEVKQYDLIEFDGNTMVFTSINNSNTRYTVHKVNPTRESKLMTYLNSKSEIDLPLSDDKTICDIIELRFRLELLVNQLQTGANEYYLNRNKINLSNFQEFYLTYEMYRVKLPLELRRKIRPIIYANKSLNEINLDSIKSMFYGIGFDTLHIARIDQRINEVDDFPICFTPLKINSSNITITIDESYSNYMRNDTLIRKVNKDIQKTKK